MNEEIKDLYVIDWLGPFDSFEALKQNAEFGVDSCFIYVVTGRTAYERSIGSMTLKLCAYISQVSYIYWQILFYMPMVCFLGQIGC